MDTITIMQGFSEILSMISKAYDAYMKYKESERRWWVRPVNLSRKEEGFFNTCTEQLMIMDEEDFLVATRISTENFNLLLTLLPERLRRYSNREAIQPKERLSLTLLYLAHGCTFKVLALSHKMGASTVRKIIYETCDAIWQELSCIYLSPPNQAEWEAIACDFYLTTGMPNCIGAIDGKHVKITCPKRSGSLYFNYKSTFSIILLAACDSKNRFTFIDVGAYGSQSDGGVFANSVFGQKILKNELDVPLDNNLPNSVVKFPYYFVADSAFPLKRNIMRPYPGRNLTCDKNYFNAKLSKARVRIEHTFGILTSRWRILNNNIHAAPKHADKIVLATTVLHNFLMINKDLSYTMDIGDLTSGSGRNNVNGCNRSSSEAFDLRNTLRDYLESNM